MITARPPVCGRGRARLQEHGCGSCPSFGVPTSDEKAPSFSCRPCCGFSNCEVGHIYVTLAQGGPAQPKRRGGGRPRPLSPR